MEQKTKIWLIILACIGLALAFYFLNFFGVLNIGKSLSVTSIDNYIPVGNELIYYGSATCPADRCYVCSSGLCNQTTYISCNNAVQTNVLFRTNVLNDNWGSIGSDGNSSWIAYSLGTGLTPFAYSGIDYETANYYTSGYYGLNGADLYLSNGDIFITKHEIFGSQSKLSSGKYCAPSTCSCGNNSCMAIRTYGCYSYETDCGTGGQIYYEFVPQALNYIQTQSSALQPYTSQNQQNLCSGNSLCKQEYTAGASHAYTCNANLYVCSQSSTCSNSGPNLIYQDSLIYQNDTQGGITNLIKAIAPLQGDYLVKGDTITLTGGDQNVIYLQQLANEPACGAGNIPKCSPDNAISYPCIQQNGNYYADVNNLTYCSQVGAGFMCNPQTGNCSFPINANIYFTNSKGISKPAFTSSDTITVNAIITSPPSSSITSGTVTLTLYKQGTSQSKDSVTVNPYDFSKGNVYPWTISTPSQNGLYYVAATVSYPGSGSVPLTLGGDPTNPKYYFTIAPQIQCGVTYSGPNKNSNVYINQPIYITVSTQNTQTILENFPNLILKQGTVQPIILNNWAAPISSCNNGVCNYQYVYNYTTPYSGPLDACATITYANLTSDQCCSPTITVGANQVTSTFTDMPGCIQPSTQTIHFTTVDSAGNLINTTNVLDVILPGQSNSIDLSNTTIQDGTGQYHFDYNFVYSNTAGEISYYFSLVSSAQGLTSSKPITGTVVVNPDLTQCNNQKVKNCKNDSDCAQYGVGWTCNTSSSVGICKAPINWMLYIIIAIVAVFAFIVIFVVIHFIRNPGQKIDVGIGGL